jgi:hypothetical protein
MSHPINTNSEYNDVCCLAHHACADMSGIAVYQLDITVSLLFCDNLFSIHPDYIVGMHMRPPAADRALLAVYVLPLSWSF